MREKKHKLLTILQCYYTIKDIEEGYDTPYYLGILQDLYISKEKLSYDKVAAKFFIDTRTLHRYRTRINNLAERLDGRQDILCPIESDEGELE